MKSKTPDQVSTPIAGGGPSSSSNEEILQDIDPAPDVAPNNNDTAALFATILKRFDNQDARLTALTKRFDDLDVKNHSSSSSFSLTFQDARGFIPPRISLMRTSHPMTHSSHRFYNKDEENEEPVTHPSQIPVHTACFLSPVLILARLK